MKESLPWKPSFALSGIHNLEFLADEFLDIWSLFKCILQVLSRSWLLFDLCRQKICEYHPIQIKTFFLQFSRALLHLNSWSCFHCRGLKKIGLSLFITWQLLCENDLSRLFANKLVARVQTSNKIGSLMFSKAPHVVYIVGGAEGKRWSVQNHRQKITSIAFWCLKDNFSLLLRTGKICNEIFTGNNIFHSRIIICFKARSLKDVPLFSWVQ